MRAVPPREVDTEIGLPPDDLEKGQEADNHQQGGEGQGNLFLPHEIDGWIADQFKHRGIPGFDVRSYRKPFELRTP